MDHLQKLVMISMYYILMHHFVSIYMYNIYLKVLFIVISLANILNVHIRIHKCH